MKEKDFRALLQKEEYLERDSLSKNIRHIQLSESVINPSGNPYYYLDAVFLGSDNEVYFFTSNKDGDDVQERIIAEISEKDLSQMYQMIIKHQILK